MLVIKKPSKCVISQVRQNSCQYLASVPLGDRIRHSGTNLDLRFHFLGKEFPPHATVRLEGVQKHVPPELSRQLQGVQLRGVQQAIARRATDNCKVCNSQLRGTQQTIVGGMGT